MDRQWNYSHKTQHFCCIPGGAEHIYPVWPSEVRRALTKQGLHVRIPPRWKRPPEGIPQEQVNLLPMHGKEFGTGILNKIYRDLGLVPPKKRSQ